MSLEHQSFEYQGQAFNRLFGTSIGSREEIAELAEIHSYGNYFYGGVLDRVISQQVFFGQGPTHKIFRQMIREAAGSRGSICTCQINVYRETITIHGILFIEDPGKNKNIVSTERTKERRLRRILRLVESLPSTMCEPEINIGWLDRTHNHTFEYRYTPEDGELLKNIRFD